MKLSRYSLCTVLSAGLLTAAFMADAALTVVGDLGGESTAPLFEAINLGPQAPGNGAPSQPPGSLTWLRKANPYVFEEMLLTAFSRQGYRIRRNASYSGDGGSDGQVWFGSQRWLIQAKRYGSAISAGHVRDFATLLGREGCRGLFIHTGRTGNTSRDAFRNHPDIVLVSGQSLLMLLAGDARWQQKLNLSPNHAGDIHRAGITGKPGH